ncbi:hypothetical protein K402DRAFT_463688 [Aulographum hederae CBS 113979]|uniref:Uncharacterized protein n=1 Tax=Aulographum hederae CBS 113979 TaxID=1176131 RepID=A0A6G1H017_9PEZI|nr:hypothetical protein K402DRAFT_463688 [Aulographum hederae CBS 113979]
MNKTINTNPKTYRGFTVTIDSGELCVNLGRSHAGFSSLEPPLLERVFGFLVAKSHQRALTLVNKQTYSALAKLLCENITIVLSGDEQALVAKYKRSLLAQDDEKLENIKSIKCVLDASAPPSSTYKAVAEAFINGLPVLCLQYWSWPAEIPLPASLSRRLWSHQFDSKNVDFYEWTVRSNWGKAKALLQHHKQLEQMSVSPRSPNGVQYLDIVLSKARSIRSLSVDLHMYQDGAYSLGTCPPLFTDGRSGELLRAPPSLSSLSLRNVDLIVSKDTWHAMFAKGELQTLELINCSGTRQFLNEPVWKDSKFSQLRDISVVLHSEYDRGRSVVDGTLSRVESQANAKARSTLLPAVSGSVYQHIFIQLGSVVPEQQSISREFRKHCSTVESLYLDVAVREVLDFSDTLEEEMPRLRQLAVPINWKLEELFINSDKLCRQVEKLLLLSPELKVLALLGNPVGAFTASAAAAEENGDSDNETEHASDEMSMEANLSPRKEFLSPPPKPYQEEQKQGANGKGDGKRPSDSRHVPSAHVQLGNEDDFRAAVEREVQRITGPGSPKLRTKESQLLGSERSAGLASSKYSKDHLGRPRQPVWDIKPKSKPSLASLAPKVNSGEARNESKDAIDPKSNAETADAEASSLRSPIVGQPAVFAAYSDPRVQPGTTSRNTQSLSARKSAGTIWANGFKRNNPPAWLDGADDSEASFGDLSDQYEGPKSNAIEKSLGRYLLERLASEVFRTAARLGSPLRVLVFGKITATDDNDDAAQVFVKGHVQSPIPEGMRKSKDASGSDVVAVAVSLEMLRQMGEEVDGLVKAREMAKLHMLEETFKEEEMPGCWDTNGSTTFSNDCIPNDYSSHGTDSGSCCSSGDVIYTPTSSSPPRLNFYQYSFDFDTTTGSNSEFGDTVYTPFTDEEAGSLEDGATFASRPDAESNSDSDSGNTVFTPLSDEDSESGEWNDNIGRHFTVQDFEYYWGHVDLDDCWCYHLDDVLEGNYLTPHEDTDDCWCYEK